MLLFHPDWLKLAAKLTSKQSPHIDAFQFIFPLFCCVLTQKESQPPWNSLQDWDRALPCVLQLHGILQAPYSSPGQQPSPSRLSTNPAMLAGAQAKFSWTPLLVLQELLECK